MASLLQYCRSWQTPFSDIAMFYYYNLYADSAYTLFLFCEKIFDLLL